MNYKNFLKQDISHIASRRNIQKWLPKILNYIKIWDKTYEVPFFTFRQRLKEIAKSTFDEIGFDATIQLHEMDEHSSCTLEECYYLISDDDDWYNPNISWKLRCSSADIVSWDDVMLTPLAKIIMRSSNSGKQLWANSWAIKKKAYLSLSSKQKESIKWHMNATKAILKDKRFTHSFLFGTRYSVACKTPASFCKYSSLLDKENHEIENHLLQWKKNHRGLSCPEELKWAKAQFQELGLLYDCLYGRFIMI